jgi:hypothetical protein
MASKTDDADCSEFDCVERLEEKAREHGWKITPEMRWMMRWGASLHREITDEHKRTGEWRTTVETRLGRVDEALFNDRTGLITLQATIRRMLFWLGVGISAALSTMLIVLEIIDNWETIMHR